MRVCAQTNTNLHKMVESDFEQIALFLHEALEIAVKLQEQSGPKLKDFVAALQTNEQVVALQKKVHQFACQFPMPGFDPKSMKYQSPDGPPSSS